MGTNQSLEVLMRQLIRQELVNLLAINTENTSGNVQPRLLAAGRGTPVRRRRPRSRRSFAGIKGKVTKATDKRLKANRAA